jgi:hypothetical protein
MYVDSSRQHILSSGIDNLRSIVAREIFSDGRDLTVADSNVAGERVSGRHHASVCDDGVKAHRVLLNWQHRFYAKLRHLGAAIVQLTILERQNQ